MNLTGSCMSLFLGIILIVWGSLIITDGGGYVGGGKWGHIEVPIPVLAGWIFLPIGIYICILSIRALRRGEGKPKKYTDEDAARAKEELDRMYMKEHGSLPEDVTRKKDA